MKTGEKLGSGYFSTVYQHPYNADKVIKVGYGDHAYLNFARWAMRKENRNNPHLPKILALKEKGDGDFVAVIERLGKLDGTAGIAQTIKREYYSIKCGDLSSINDASPRLAKTINDIQSTFGNQHSIDMHPGNYMMRGDTVVITDPIAF